MALQVTQSVTDREKASAEDIKIVPYHLHCVIDRCKFDMCILTRLSTKSKVISISLAKFQSITFHMAQISQYT